jgi:hypothetical protein
VERLIIQFDKEPELKVRIAQALLRKITHLIKLALLRQPWREGKPTVRPDYFSELHP